MTNDQQPPAKDSDNNISGFDLDSLQYLIDEIQGNTLGLNPSLEQKWIVDSVPTPKQKTQSHLPESILIERHPQKRKTVLNLRKIALETLMPELPPEDTDYFIIATGKGRRKNKGAVVESFGFGDFIQFVVSKFGAGCVVDVSTWSMNKDHAFMLMELLDYGTISELRILCDRSLETRKQDVMGILKNGTRQFNKFSLKMFRNHSKVYCFRNVDGTRVCTITGSANLSGTPRAENYVVTTSPDVYYPIIDGFFDPMFSESVTYE